MTPDYIHHILVVDDVPVLAEMLAISLRGDTCDVTVASSAAEALRLARGLLFDLIISDLAMPGVDGYTLAKELRAQPAYRKVPMIAITGFGNCEDERIWEAGFTECLSKPLELDRLSEVVRKLLGK